MARESVRIEGLDGVLAVLRSLPGELVSKRGGVIRLAARKAAKIIADQAKANVRAVVAEPNIGGRPSKSTGALERSIVVSRSRTTGNAKGEAVIVKMKGSKKRKYAGNKRNVRKGRAGQTYETAPPTYYGSILEKGSSRMRPHPWMRPAFDSKKTEALETFVSDLKNRLSAVIKRLEMEKARK